MSREHIECAIHVGETLQGPQACNIVADTGIAPRSETIDDESSVAPFAKQRSPCSIRVTGPRAAMGENNDRKRSLAGGKNEFPREWNGLIFYEGKAGRLAGRLVLFSPGNHQRFSTVKPDSARILVAQRGLDLLGGVRPRRAKD
jgi:hypothetical protein